MCVDQKCISVSNLRKHLPKCPQNCSGNGWCNNKGHCHCKYGFEPPYCNSHGFGGSLDSGPPMDPNGMYFTLYFFDLWTTEFNVNLFLVFEVFYSD